MKNLALLFGTVFIFCICGCKRQIRNPNELGEYLCDCYSKYIPKKGISRGARICDSLAREKNKLYDIFLTHNSVERKLTEEEQSSYEAAREFEVQVQMYISKHCEGYFWKEYTPGSPASDSIKRWQEEGKISKEP